MNEHFEPNDAMSDDVLQELLRDHYDAPVPEHLLERLDGELVQALEEKQQLNVAVNNGKTTTASKRKATKESRGMWSRSSVRFIGAAAATAVCWMILFSGDGAGNCSWASMVKAMKAQPWLEVVTSGSDESEGWLSISSRVIFRNGTSDSTDKSVWTKGVRSVYIADAGAIFQDHFQGDLEMSDEEFVKASLLRLILGHAVDQDLDDWRVVEESRTDAGKLMELTLRFEHQRLDDRSLSVVFGIDKRTQLPAWMRILDAGGSQRVVDLNYVAAGPSSIYELDVPREAEVVDGLALAATRAGVETLGAIDKETSLPLPADDAKQEFSRSVSQLPTPSQSEMSLRVDELLQEHWAKHSLTPTKPAAEAEFLRRIYLDLTGRIPTIAEIRRFEKDTSERRRSNLIDELLLSRDHANHLGSIWRAILLPTEADLTNLGGVAKLDSWLAGQFRDNVPYDLVVQKLLLAEGRVTETGPVLFYAAVKLNPEEIAAQASRAFLGTRLECAQCHDHPFDHWTQEEFWGMAAYFARISRPQGKLEMVSPVMRVADNGWGDVKLPDTDSIIAPRLPFPLAALESAEATDTSRRQQFADWLTSPLNAQFSKATVNRVWAHLFGRGLVDPVDDMGSHNPPTCPEVLDELTEYFVQSGFDLRELITMLVETKAYQLSSRTTEDDPARAAAFAQMNIKSFTAEQLYDCIAVATLRQSKQESAAVPDPLGRFEDGSRQSFLEQFRVPPGSRTDYQAGIPQALTLINGNMVSEATVETGELLQSIQAPFFTNEQRVEMLFLATVSRKPTDQEAKTMQAYLASTDDDLTQAERLGDILWTLLNCAEFTLNH